MAKMSSEIKDGILWIQFSGSFERHTMDSLVNQYVYTIKRSNCRRVLVDRRDLDGRLLFTESYFTIHSHRPLLPDVYTVFVEKEENKNLTDFESQVLRSIGYDKFAYCFSLEEALDWLNRQDIT